MPHPLEQRLALLRDRVRRLVMVHGLSWMAGVGLAAVILAGLADAVFRFEDRGIRVLASLSVLAVLGWTGYRRVYAALRAPLGNVDLARRVQRAFPNLGDSLASAVEFLEQPEEDVRGGSVSLRRAVIAKTTADTERLDFCAVTETRHAVRALSAMVAMSGVALLLLAAWPLASRIALARLVNPMADTPWPQVNHLVVRTPVDRIARGQAFEVEITDADSDRLPAQVRISYRLEEADGSLRTESEPMRRVDDVMVARRENVERSFWFRAEGGDDRSMPWQRVEVLDPPEIETMSVTLHPPAYTGWPSEPGDRSIRALIGTRVAIRATVTKPLSSAAVCLEAGAELPAAIGEDGLTFVVDSGPAPFVVERSGSYWFRLTDQDGLVSGSEARWDIRAVPDNPPSANVEQPTADIFVTPQATIPLRVAAKDDLAIRSVDLEFTLAAADGKPERLLSLYRGPDRAEPREGGLPGMPGSGESVAAPYEWKLADIGLRPGMVVTFRGVTSDYKPQSAKSEPRRLSIITAEELADRLAARQAALSAELTRVLQMQRKAREQVTAIEVQASAVGQLAQADVDRLRGAELTQRQVAQSLTDRAQGVPSHVVALLADLANNKIDSPDVQRRMQAILAEIDRLAAKELASAGQELTAAIKAAQVRLEESQAKPSRDPAVADPLTEAGKSQERVIASLEQMVGELSRWDRFRRFHRDMGELVRNQQDINRDAAEVARRTLGRELKDLPPQDTADLRLAGRRQIDLSLRLDRILQEMDSAAEPLRDEDPLAAQAVSDALARARELGISGQMRAAGGQLERNQMGDAMAKEQKILEDLREVLDILANRREHELARLVKKFQEAEADLAQIAQRQEGLRKQLQQAAAEETAKQPDTEKRRRQLERLTAEQKQLQQEAERMARRLERLTAQQAAQSTQKAADKMGQAGQCCQPGKCGEACQNAEEAQKNLEEARRQLGQQRRQAEAELATEQLSRLEDAFKGLHQRQTKALAETQRLDNLRKAQEQWTEGQNVSLTELAREQKMLRAEGVALAEKLAAAKVIHLALSAVTDQMAVAAGWLDRRETGPPPQQAEQAALDKISQLLDALKPEPPVKKPDDGGGAGGKGGKGGQPPNPAALQALAELKLLKLMQQDVNRRTELLHETVRNGKLRSEEAVREYARLSEEQGQLADLSLAIVPLKEESEPRELDDFQPPKSDGPKEGPKTEPAEDRP